MHLHSQVSAKTIEQSNAPQDMYKRGLKAIAALSPEMQKEWKEIQETHPWIKK